jgi:hypothetical protein
MLGELYLSGHDKTKIRKRRCSFGPNIPKVLFYGISPRDFGFEYI